MKAAREKVAAVGEVGVTLFLVGRVIQALVDSPLEENKPSNSVACNLKLAGV